MTRLRDVSAQIWVDDRDFVQRSLAAGLVPDSALNIVKLGDFTRTGEMGMSFGGTTAASLYGQTAARLQLIWTAMTTTNTFKRKCRSIDGLFRC